MKPHNIASLSIPTRNFYARSRSSMIRFQPKRHAKIRTVLQSSEILKNLVAEDILDSDSDVVKLWKIPDEQSQRQVQ